MSLTAALPIASSLWTRHPVLALLSTFSGTPQAGTGEPRYVAAYTEGLEMGYVAKLMVLLQNPHEKTPG